MSNFTLIYYYVPEDGETQTELNTYGIPKNKEAITLKDVRASFPLKGKYTFRFLTKHNKANIFVDVLSEDDNVPIADKKVVVKANRISWEQKSNAGESRAKDRFDFEFN